MGEYADMALEQELDVDFIGKNLSRKKSINFLQHRMSHDLVWKQRTGEVILMKHMEDAHITRSIEMLERINQTGTKAYRGLVAERNSRLPKMSLTERLRSKLDTSIHNFKDEIKQSTFKKLMNSDGE